MYRIKTKGLSQGLRSAKKDGALLDIYTVEGMERVPKVPGAGRQCPPPTYAGCKVAKLNGNVTLELSDGSSISIPCSEIGGVRRLNTLASV